MTLRERCEAATLAAFKKANKECGCPDDPRAGEDVKTYTGKCTHCGSVHEIQEIEVGDKDDHMVIRTCPSARDFSLFAPVVYLTREELIESYPNTEKAKK